MIVDPNHPKTTFGFFLDGEPPSPDFRSLLFRAIGRLAASREWLIEPPAAIYEETVADDGVTDLNAGGVLTIYSQIAPLTLAKSLSRIHLAEVEAMIGCAEAISLASGATFICEVGTAVAGAVTRGAADEGIELHLLEEWRRSFEEPSS